MADETLRVEGVRKLPTCHHCQTNSCNLFHVDQKENAEEVRVVFLAERKLQGYQLVTLVLRGVRWRTVNPVRLDMLQ